MLKKHLTLITALILTLVCFGQQNGKAYYYTKSAEHAKTNSNTDDSSLRDMEFVLTFTKDLAKYELKDGISLKTEDKLALIFSGYAGPYFFDFENTDVYRIEEDYLIQKKANSIKWTLTKEKLKLNGFTCFKATAELEFRNRSRVFTKPVVAWYTPELSINAGPNGFCGLPGLIIQLEYRNVVTRLSKIKYSESPPKVSIPKNKDVITEEAFNLIIREIISKRDKN